MDNVFKNADYKQLNDYVKQRYENQKSELIVSLEQNQNELATLLYEYYIDTELLTKENNNKDKIKEIANNIYKIQTQITDLEDNIKFVQDDLENTAYGQYKDFIDKLNDVFRKIKNEK